MAVSVSMCVYDCVCVYVCVWLCLFRNEPLRLSVDVISHNIFAFQEENKVNHKEKYMNYNIFRLGHFFLPDKHLENTYKWA